MNWPLGNCYDKDIRSDIIDEPSDAGGVAARGISPENICSVSCNEALYVWSTRCTGLQSPGAGASPRSV